MSFPRMIRNVLKPHRSGFFLLLLLQNKAEQVWSLRKLVTEFLKGFTQSLGTSESLLQRSEKQQNNFHHGWFSPCQLERKR